VELHERGQIGKTHVVGARGHARDGSSRARTGVDGDIQARGLVVALGFRLQKEGRRPFKAPIELELHGGLGVGQAHEVGCAQQGGGLQQMALVHE